MREPLRRRDAVVEVLSTTLLWKLIIAMWVCATIRFSSLRGSGISAFCAAARPPLPTRGQVVARLGLHALGRDRRTGLAGAGRRPRRTSRTPGCRGRCRRASRGRAAVSGPAASSAGDSSSPSIDVGAVHGQVVVDELAEVGVAGGDLPVAAAADDHRAGQLAGDGRVQGVALRARPGRSGTVAVCRPARALRLAGLGVVRLRDRVALVAGAATHLGGQEALALDEEGLRSVLHPVTTSNTPFRPDRPALCSLRGGKSARRYTVDAELPQHFLPWH